MEEWKEYRLGDVCTITSSKRIFANEYQNYGIPFYRGKEIIEKQKGEKVSNELFISKDKYDEIKKKHGVPSEGDMLLTSVGTIGIPYIVQDEIFYFKDGNLTWFQNFNGINNRFLYYWFFTPFAKSLIDSKAIGSTQKALTIDTLKKFEIKLPSINEQKRIVSILKSLDDKIENNRKINENLEQQAQALFKSWFVDFEPFRDQPFVESELGMIPEGWRVYSLPEIVNVYSGYSYKGSELKESNNAMATIKNFDRSGGFKVDGYKEIELSDRIKSTQFTNLFDVIVAHTDLTQNAEIIGNPALILNKNGYDKIIISMDLCKVVPKTSFISNTLLYCILNDSRFKQHALGYVNGTTVLHLNKKALPDYKIALPCDLSNLFTITKAIDPLFRAESNNIIESSRLSQLRDTLLPRLMSGELSVK